MVQILVKIKDDSQALREWAIIEVQGDLESSTGDTIGGKLIGHLIFSSKERPILIIGYHILYGKVVENNPPLAVLKRSRQSSPDQNKAASSTEYSILALVRKKITFRTRPKPIIAPFSAEPNKVLTEALVFLSLCMPCGCPREFGQLSRRAASISPAQHWLFSSIILSRWKDK